jgi:hypothetical protein
VEAPADGSAGGGVELVALLVDGRVALAGTLVPAEQCQAVTGANPALLAVVGAYMGRRKAAPTTPSSRAEAQAAPDRAAWLEWETAKQRRLWRLRAENHVA